MLGKPKLPLLVNDPKRRDLQFYSGYDERFLYRKVRILGAVLNDLNLLQQFPPEDWDQFEADLAKSPGFRLVYNTDDAKVFVLSQAR